LATKNPKNKKFAKKMKKKTEKTPPLPSLFPSTMADLGHRYIENSGVKSVMQN